MLVFSVPRVYEKIYGRVLAAGTSGSALKKADFPVVCAGWRR